MCKLLKDHIDCTDLLERIRLYVPGRSLRHPTSFFLLIRIGRELWDYGKHKPVDRLCSLANDFSLRINYFHANPGTIRKQFPSWIRV